MRTRTKSSILSTSEAPVPDGTPGFHRAVPIALDGFAGLGFTLTSGREVYPAVGGGEFAVGPVSVTASVRPGEELADVYHRLRAIVEVLFQAEYEMKRTTYYARRNAHTPTT